MGPLKLLCLSALLLASPAGASELDKFGAQFNVKKNEVKKDDTDSKGADGLWDFFFGPSDASTEARAAEQPGYDEGFQLTGELGIHGAQGQVAGLIARGRLVPERYGFDLSYTGYSEAEAESTQLSLTRMAGLLRLYSRSGFNLFGGAGFSALKGASTRAGPSAVTALQWRVFGPFVVEGEASSALISGHALWDLRGGLAAGFGPLGLMFGWRDVRGPVAYLAGPEITLGLRF